MGHVIQLSTKQGALLSELQRELARLNEARSQLLQSIDSTRQVTADQLFTAIRALDQAATRACATKSKLPPGPYQELFEEQIRQIINVLGDARACALTLDRELQTMSGGAPSSASPRRVPSVLPELGLQSTNTVSETD